MDIKKQYDSQNAIIEKSTSTDWLSATAAFFDLLKTENTRRTYRFAVRSLLAFTGLQPWEIKRSDVAIWAQSMTNDGLAPATINVRLSAVSAYFQFIQDEFNLVEINPAAGRTMRRTVAIYEKSNYLTPDQIAALLAQIDQNSEIGSRDYALILGYLTTGRRNSEFRRLKWGEIKQRGDKTVYTWRGKGKTRTDVLPAAVHEAIRKHLLIARRRNLADDDFVFTPLTDTAANFPTVEKTDWNRNRPISLRQINRRLQYYAAGAGLAGVHVHILRHSAAMILLNDGTPVEQISAFLAHSNIQTTQIYLHELNAFNADLSDRIGDIVTGKK